MEPLTALYHQHLYQHMHLLLNQHLYQHWHLLLNQHLHIQALKRHSSIDAAFLWTVKTATPPIRCLLVVVRAEISDVALLTFGPIGTMEQTNASTHMRMTLQIQCIKLKIRVYFYRFRSAQQQPTSKRVWKELYKTLQTRRRRSTSLQMER